MQCSFICFLWLVAHFGIAKFIVTEELSISVQFINWDDHLFPNRQKTFSFLQKFTRKHSCQNVLLSIPFLVYYPVLCGQIWWLLVLQPFFYSAKTVDMVEWDLVVFVCWDQTFSGQEVFLLGSEEESPEGSGLPEKMRFSRIQCTCRFSTVSFNCLSSLDTAAISSVRLWMFFCLFWSVCSLWLRWESVSGWSPICVLTSEMLWYSSSTREFLTSRADSFWSTDKSMSLTSGKCLEVSAWVGGWVCECVGWMRAFGRRCRTLLLISFFSFLLFFLCQVGWNTRQ